MSDLTPEDLRVLGKRWNRVALANYACAWEAEQKQAEADRKRLAQLEREATWAAEFTCPKCGPCTYQMVTTQKACLHCDSLLIRSKHPSMKALERVLKRALPYVADIRDFNYVLAGQIKELLEDEPSE